MLLCGYSIDPLISVQNMYGRHQSSVRIKFEHAGVVGVKHNFHYKAVQSNYCENYATEND